MTLKNLTMVAAVLVVVGALNWGLVGLLDLNLVETLFGKASKLVYIVVGLSAVWVAWDMWGKAPSKKR